MDPAKLAELRANNVGDIKDQLADLDLDDLTALLEAESADENPRKGVVNAIEADIERREAEAAAKLAKGAKGAKAAKSEPAALTFRDLDYDGPLTGDQAEWRNKHLFAWRDPTTKPVKPAATK